MGTSKQVVTHNDPALPVRLACDASPICIGAGLLHVMPDGSERSVAFVSRSMTKTESRYAPIDKEAFSIVWGMTWVSVGGGLRSLQTTGPSLSFSTERMEFPP